MASSTASPPRMPVSQSWTTATRPKDNCCVRSAGEEATPASLSTAVILLPSAFRFRLGRRLQRVFVRLRTLVADVVIPQVLFGRHLGQAAHAVMLPGSLVEMLRRSVVVHTLSLSRGT